MTKKKKDLLAPNLKLFHIKQSNKTCISFPYKLCLACIFRLSQRQCCIKCKLFFINHCFETKFQYVIRNVLCVWKFTTMLKLKHYPDFISFSDTRRVRVFLVHNIRKIFETVFTKLLLSLKGNMQSRFFPSVLLPPFSKFFFFFFLQWLWNLTKINSYYI